MVDAADSVTAGEVGNRWMFKKDSSEQLLYGTISGIMVVIYGCFCQAKFTGRPLLYQADILATVSPIDARGLAHTLARRLAWCQTQ